ncbi:hypothetical protein MLD38_032291 [Melastoma candidum]|uniref:Uncharacterized protein n=1 Tax=Melastoma candidum TaxID=119954 RepID=A0ACB9M3B9_9MYRT|nr:hypothetical protein MLD38_032291 [Melastoma candidum]
MIAAASSSSPFPSLSALSSSSSSSFLRSTRWNVSPSLPFPSRAAVRVSQRRCQTLRVRSMRHPNRAPVVTHNSWDELVLKSEIPVLVEFYASWCGPCRMVHRMIDEIAEEFAQDIKCFILNADADLDIAQRYEVKAVPVVLLFKNGQRCESVVGTMPKDFYVAAIQRVLDS